MNLAYRPTLPTRSGSPPGSLFGLGKRRLFVSICLSVATFAGTLASALPVAYAAGPNDADENRGSTADAGAILLLVHGDDLPRERLRDALAAELHNPIALSGTPAAANANQGVITVTYRQAARELAVTWDGPKRGTVSRVVSAPSKIDDVVRDAAMLAGNLARDEADDLVKPAMPPLPPPQTPAPSPPVVVTLPPPGEKRDAGAGKENDKDIPVTASAFYPLATNLGRPYAKDKFELNLFYGRSGQLDGAQIGGVNVVTPAEGRGTGDVSGLSLAYAANIATGKVEGVQVAPVINVAGKGIEGWQTAFLINRSGGNVDGLQAAFGINSTAGTTSGAQVAAVNVSGDVNGAQIGLINVGKKITGTTIGLINVADDIDGVPIGIASVTKTGGVHPQAWVSNASFGNIGIKLATKHTYTMPSFHFHHAYERDFVGAGFTIGGHIPIGENGLGPYVDTDLSFAWLYAPTRTVDTLPTGGVDTYHQHIMQPRIRAIFGYRFAEHFGLFGGAGLLTQARFLHDGNETLIRLGPEFVFGVEL